MSLAVLSNITGLETHPRVGPKLVTRARWMTVRQSLLRIHSRQHAHVIHIYVTTGSYIQWIYNDVRCEYMHVCVRACVCACVHVCACVLHICVCMCICLCACVYMNAWIHAFIFTNTTLLYLELVQLQLSRENSTVYISGAAVDGWLRRMRRKQVEGKKKDWQWTYGGND